MSTIESAPRLSEAADNHIPKNFYLGVINGALAQLGVSVMHPHLVLNAFVYEWTQSAFLSGLLATLTPLGMMWPQLFVSSLIEHRPRKKPYYVLSMALRIIALVAIVASIWLTGHLANPLVGVGLFMLGFFAFQSAQAMGLLPFFDIVAQTIHPVHLGPFFGYRSLFGGILVLFSGWLIVHPILHAVPEPNSYALLVVIAALTMTVGWTTFAFAHEEENEDPPERRNIRELLRDSLRTLRKDANYRLLLISGVLFRVNVMAVAFYVPYGVERFGARKMAGVFLGIFTLGKLLSSWAWGTLSNRLGNRVCLILSAGFFTLSPLLALAAPRVPAGFALETRVLPMALTLQFGLYLAAIMVFGFALQGTMIARNSFVLETAPSDRVPSYRAFLDTTLLPMLFLPVLVGLLVRGADGRVDTVRAEIMFLCIVASGLLSIFAALRFREVRGESGSRA